MQRPEYNRQGTLIPIDGGALPAPSNLSQCGTEFEEARAFVNSCLLQAAVRTRPSKGIPGAAAPASVLARVPLTRSGFSLATEERLIEVARQAGWTDQMGSAGEWFRLFVWRFQVRG
jgi:hypothetical protein